MKDFVTAAKDHTQEGSDFGFDVEFRIDKGGPKERLMVAHKPSDGQITIFIAMAGDDLAANSEVVARSINFLYSLLDQEDRRYFQKRLLDMNDEFGAEEVADILSYILEEWTGKASGSPTASPRSQRPAGRSSTTSRRKTA